MNDNTGSMNGEDGGGRLDAFLAQNQPAESRSVWKSLIQSGDVQVNNKVITKPNYKVSGNDTISWTLPDEASEIPLAENIPLNILFEDDDLLVLIKPAGLVVHPAVGNDTGTLLNALLFHDDVFQTIERAGIVHRLDKDTSGLLVVAKTEKALEELRRQFKDRETEKEYLALVWGYTPPEKRIETLLGRHPRQRQKQAVLEEDGREAISHYETLTHFGETSLLKVKIETGRTHQIRVHLSHEGYPIVGDKIYGRPRKSKIPIKPKRQMLHAQKLSFTHPVTGKRLSFEAPLPKDMESLLEQLQP